MFPSTSVPENSVTLSAPGRRIVIIGTTGSGKTTLASRLAHYLGAPHIELDAVHWGPQWTPVPTDVFRERIAEMLASDTWVVDGNYSQVRDIVWQHADTIIWLDFSLSLILLRLLRRTIGRVFLRRELWNGNRERFITQFFSRDSLFLWAINNYHRRRREYPQIFARPEFAGLTIIHLTSPRRVRRWVAALTKPSVPT